LFKSKWSALKNEATNEFLAYFKQEWIVQHPGWYEGYAPGVPSTNNALESTNGSIKKDCTIRKRLALARFLELVETKIIMEWSTNRNPDKPISPVLFVTATPISHQLWVDAFHTSISNRESIAIDNKRTKEKIHYMCSGRELSNSLKVFYKDYKQHKDNLSWNNFDALKDYQSSLWQINFVENKTQWKESTCNCKNFQKDYICKHLIVLAIRYGYEIVPLTAQTVELGCKVARGRPARVTKALNVIPVPPSKANKRANLEMNEDTTSKKAKKL
jgi:hypothetical protein